MDKITNKLIRKFDIGLDINKLQEDFNNLLPQIEEISWWGAEGATHQFQFAVQSKFGSNNPYHECCGPQPSLNKEDGSNPLNEGSFNIINDMFIGTCFEDVISKLKTQNTELIKIIENVKHTKQEKEGTDNEMEIERLRNMLKMETLFPSNGDRLKTID